LYVNLISSNNTYATVSGNIAGHPLQDKHTNAVVDVKPEEAELTLEVIDELLDHYSVQEPKTKETTERIHAKYDATKKHSKDVAFANPPNALSEANRSNKL
jgi:hypothetical protein